jgi:integrase
MIEMLTRIHFPAVEPQLAELFAARSEFNEVAGAHKAAYRAGEAINLRLPDFIQEFQARLEAALAKIVEALHERSLGYARPFFRWAFSEGLTDSIPDYRPGSPPPPSRDRVLSLSEVRAIWSAAQRLGYPFGQAIRLLVLTPLTRETVGGMRLSDLAAADNGGWFWTPHLHLPGQYRWCSRLPPPANAVLRSTAIRPRRRDRAGACTGGILGSGGR